MMMELFLLLIVIFYYLNGTGSYNALINFIAKYFVYITILLSIIFLVIFLINQRKITTIDMSIIWIVIIYDLFLIAIYLLIIKIRNKRK